MTVKPGAQAGQKLRLAGKGLRQRGEGAGDLYAVLRIVMPTPISEREQELYRELAEASSFSTPSALRWRVERWMTIV